MKHLHKRYNNQKVIKNKKLAKTLIENKLYFLLFSYTNQFNIRK